MHSLLPLMRNFVLSFFVLINFALFSQCPDVDPSFTITTSDFCGIGPHNLDIDNTSSGPNAGTAEYEWYVDGVLVETTNGTVSPNLSVNGINTFDIEMVVIDGPPPCTEAVNQTVNVTPEIDASFNFSPNNDCAGETISFTNTSTNVIAGTTYDWDFGDGNSSSQENPSHEYAFSGSYTVTLTVDGPGCSSTTTETVDVSPTPVVAISADNDFTCLSAGSTQTTQEVNFSNFTSGAVSYFWDFGDGNTSTDFEPTHTYTTYGTFQVEMTATGANGCTATETVQIVFERNVFADLSLPLGEYEGCVPHSLPGLENQSSLDAVSFTWDFGDGTVITTSSYTPPAHTYTSTGSYTIQLQASNNCNSNFSSIGTIDVIDVPNTNFTPSTTNGCAPETVTFNNTTTGDSPTYEWDMGNGNTYPGLTTPPPQTYDTSGVYTVSLTATNSCGSNIESQDIFIDTIPIAEFLADPIEGCSPLEVEIDNLSTGNVNTYRWYRSDVVGNFEGVWTYNQNVGPITYTVPPGDNPIIRNIRLRVSNNCGFTEVDQDIIIRRPNQANFTASSQNICVGDTVTFNNNSLGEEREYEWDFGEGTTSTLEGPFEIEYNTPGTYTVRLIVDGFCEPDTLERVIEVNPFPVVDFNADIEEGCQDLEVNFTNNSTPTANMNWSFGTGAVPNNSNDYTPNPIIYTVDGVQTVYLTASENGCSTIDSTDIEVFPIPDVDFDLSTLEGCSPLEVDITNNSIDTGTETFEWEFGNGNTFNGFAPPSETFTAVSATEQYDVILRVTNSDNCIDSLVREVTVYPLPEADFDFVENQLCSNVAFEVVNNSTGGNTYDWDFDDGNSSTDFEPSHQFAADGTYEVKLEVESVNNCIDSIRKTIIIDSIPTADFDFINVCFGFETEFTDQSSNSPVDYSWNFGDGSPLVTDQNPMHTFLSSGNYDVRLTVQNSIGCADSIEQNVTVYTPPQADFDVEDLCFNDLTLFIDQSIGNSGTIIDYEWDLDDGVTSTDANPSHTYSGIDVYDISLTVEDDLGCRDTLESQIEVTGIPNSDFDFTEECRNDTATFTDLTTGNPDVYEWNFGDGSPINTDTNPTHVFNGDGTFQVVLVTSFSASGCSDTAEYNVTIFPRTEPDFDADPVCFTFESEFTDLTTNNPISWNWEFDDAAGGTSSAQNPTYEYTQVDNYDVKLITENSFGCIDSIIREVIVHPLPVPDFTFDTVCLNTSSQIQDLSSGATDWFYDMGDGNTISGDDSPFYTYNSAGTFDINQIVTNSFGCQDSIEQTITVNPNPSAAFSADEACFSYFSSFTDASSVDAENWEWDFDDGGASSNQQNPTYTFSADGNYDVTLTVFNEFGCQDETTENVTVLPNPTAQFDNSTVCADGDVEFTNTSLGAPIDFEWDFGDGSPIVNIENPSHLYPSGGSYDVTFIVENNVGCSDTIVEEVSVFTVPDVNFDVDIVCLGNVSNFIDQTNDLASLDEFQWDFGDGNQSNSQNPNYIYETAGTFPVTLVVINEFGCSDTIVDDYTVAEIPIADFEFDLGCLSDSIIFTDISSANPIEWTWNFGDGTVVDGGPVENHQYDLPGDYVVTLFVESAGGDCNDQTSQVVTFDALGAEAEFPQEVCAQNDFEFNSNSFSTEGDSVTFLWSMGDGTFYNQNSGVHSYDEEGSYEVSLYVESELGCDEIIQTINVIGCTDLIIPEVFTPNGDGANDFFQLLNIEFYSCLNIEIFNRWGTQVYTSSCYDNSWDGRSNSNYNVGGDELPESTYFYLITIPAEDNNGEEKVIKGNVYLKR